jgi:uncharacterized protein YkwD
MVKRVAAGVAAAIALLLVVWAVSTHLPNGIGYPGAGTFASTTATSTSSSISGVPPIPKTSSPSASPGKWLQDPAFVGNSSKIEYPPFYAVLANFTLGVINKDRASAGLGPVILSSVPSGQQHADSMAFYGYFSHWDNQGYKPYMRYSLLGGTGGVAENAALNYCNSSPPDSTDPTPAPCGLQTVENAINGSEWEMMNNDTTCCNNGHRENILQPMHNRVSVGIAYNSTAVYLVEDFENSYITSGSLQVAGGVVTFQGSVGHHIPGWMRTSAGAEITVYFDPTPGNIGLNELNLLPSCSQFNELNEPSSCRYQGAYTPGVQVSTVFAPCPAKYICSAGNYTYAQTWQEAAGNFNIVFSISALESTYGNGIYTFYLWPTASTSEPITSLSVFVKGA